MDAVNHRINKYIDGKYSDSIQLKSRYKPYDLLIEHGVIYVLTEYSLETYDKEGKRINIKKLTDDKSKILHGVWRLFKVDDGFIITTKPGRANGNIICLKSDMNYGSCGKWSKLFDKHEVYDKVNDNIVINSISKTVWIDDDENVIKSINHIDLGEYDQLFPIVLWYRFKGNYIYTMKASKNGVDVNRIHVGMDN